MGYLNKICVYCKKPFSVKRYRKNTARCCSVSCSNQQRRLDKWKYPVPITDVIRIARVPGKYSIDTVYIFKCINKFCNNELRIWETSKKSHTGLCLSCQHKKRPYESTYSKLRTAFSFNKYENSITYEEFLGFVKKNCAYCGSKLSWSKYSCRNEGIRNNAGYNLDRKNPKEGYSIDNCVPCCPACNKVKGDTFTYSEFMMFSVVLKKIIKLRKLNNMAYKRSLS